MELLNLNLCFDVISTTIPQHLTHIKQVLGRTSQTVKYYKIILSILHMSE